MKRFIAFSWLLCFVMIAYADTEVGNLEYSVNNGTATVTRVASNFPGGPITIPAEVTIGDDTYPVKTIAANAFRNNTVITEVIIQEGVETIGSNTFNGASNLVKITLPASVTTIGGSAFQNCNKLEKATFASIEALCGITFDGSVSNPLYYAKHLWIAGEESERTTLAIPGTVTAIPNYAFQNCSSLTSVIIKAGVETIGTSSFDGCSGLVSVTIPSTVTQIKKNAFNVGNSNALEKAIFADIESLCNIDFADVNSNPLYNAHHLFIENGTEEEVTGITLPNTDIIKARVFAGASNITRVVIPMEVDSIGDNAFLDCNKINTVIFDDLDQLQGMKYGTGIANPLYYGATPVIEGAAVGTLTFNADIEDNAFTNAKWLTEITIGPGVTKIGKNAFKSCTNLTTITFSGNDLTTIEDEAFNACSALRSIELPSSLTTIDTLAFRDTKLTSITIPTACTTLGTSIFENCTALTKATFSSTANLPRLPNAIFKGCNNLRDITIPDAIETIGEGAFQGCSKLSDPPISPSMTTISNNAFNGCTGIVDLVLSEKGKLETIGVSAFSGCSKITMVSLPATIDKVDNYAFSGCTSLSDIYIYRESVPSVVYDNTFGGRQNEILLHVENETAENNFKNNPVWKDFKEIVIKADYTLTFYKNEVYETSITGEAGKPIQGEDLDILNNLRIRSTEDKAFSGWWNNNGQKVEFPAVYPSENISYYGYYSTKDESGKIHYLLEPAETLNGRGLTARATVIGHHLTQSDTSIEIGGEYENTIDSKTYTIDSIAPSALAGIEAASVKLLPTIKGIGDAAFKNCPNLSKVEIPTSLSRISNNAFEGCTSLSTIEIPTNVKEIGYQAFCNTAIENITIPASIETLGNEVFKNCKSLVKAVFADGFELPVPKYTFWNCTKLSDITLSSNMNTILHYAFQNCDAIRNLDFLNSIANIYDYAFANCDSLKTITLPGTISYIGKKAFTECSKIAQISVRESDNAPSAAKDAFDQTTYTSAYLYVDDSGKFTTEPWSNFVHKVKAQEYTLTYKVDGEIYTVNDEKQTFQIMVGTPVTPIAEPEKAGHEFSHWQDIPVVMPGENIVVSGKFKYQLSFSYADGSQQPANANEFSLPEAQSYFFGDAIDQAAIEEALQWAGFAYDELVIPETMPNNDIVINVMYRQSEQETTFAYKNNTLNYRVYLLQDKAEVIASPDVTGVITIPSEITYNNDSYPVKCIQNGAFEGNQNITGMTIEASIDSIGRRAFFDNRFTSFTIPASVERIGADAFLYCASMKRLEFAEGSHVMQLPSGVFRNCYALENVTLPSSITKIGKTAFTGCSNLKSITTTSENMPEADISSFDTKNYEYAKLRVPSTINVDGMSSPWNRFVDKARVGEEGSAQKCATPTVIYNKGKLIFSCATPDAEINSWIEVDDAAQKNIGGEWTLVKKYTVKAYAHKVGWITSDEIQNATITWCNGTPVFGEGFQSVVLEKSTRSDVDGDGIFNTADAAEILKILVNQ